MRKYWNQGTREKWI